MATAEDDSADRVGYIFHSCSVDDLKPGDHIYCHRFLYSHHGIYIGERGCEVIHFSADEKGSLEKKKGRIDRKTMEEITQLTRELEQLPEDSERAKEIRQRLDEIHNNHERLVCIKSTTLDKFCNGDSVRLVSYNSNGIKKVLKFVRSSCHTVKAMPPSETIKLAKHFLHHPDEWDNYHLQSNNCETFACFCKTGMLKIAAQLHRFDRTTATELLQSDESCHTFEEALQKYRKNMK